MADDLSLLDGFEGMYSDGYGEVKCYTVHEVKTRVVHQCPGMFNGEQHEIPVGSRAVVERAIVDNKRCSVYTCEPCIRAWQKME